MTTTERNNASRERKEQTLFTTGKVRNKGLKFSIQALKATHKAAGGTHFHAHSQTHGHPIGRYFIESEGRGIAKRFYVRTLAADKSGRQNAAVSTVAGPLLTHAGAMSKAKALA